MKWKMSDQSLFAILLRSPWWISLAVAVAVVGLARLLLPEAYRIHGALLGLPFLVIAGIAAWKRMQAPSTARIDSTLQAIRAMSWQDFAKTVEEAYRRDGYEVSRVDRPPADFAIRKTGRISLVSGKRWKVARTGIEPLRALQAAKEAGEAHECIHITVGEVTDSARKFAAEHKIRLLGGAELAQLLPAAGRRK